MIPCWSRLVLARSHSIFVFSVVTTVLCHLFLSRKGVDSGNLILAVWLVVDGLELFSTPLSLLHRDGGLLRIVYSWRRGFHLISSAWVLSEARHPLDVRCIRHTVCPILTNTYLIILVARVTKRGGKRWIKLSKLLGVVGAQIHILWAHVLQEELPFDKVTFFVASLLQVGLESISIQIKNTALLSRSLLHWLLTKFLIAVAVIANLVVGLNVLHWGLLNQIAGTLMAQFACA